MPRVDFDWEIGEGAPENLPPQGGDQSDAPIPKPGAAVERPAWPSARTKRAVLIVACVLLLTGAIAMAIVARHVEDVTARLIKDVLAAHDLVRHAVAQSDEDLFDSLLARGDAGWRTAYRQLFKQGALIDRAPLGLSAQADDARIASVTLSPDLTQAEVVSEHAYAVEAAGGLTETVRLRQIAIYRFEKGQWLLAPPEDEFWGVWLTHDGRWLTLVYPESDAEIGRRLATDLDAVLDGLCAAQIGIGCPAGLHVQAQLTRLPFVLVGMFDRRQAAFYTYNPYRPPAANETTINLPAPSLVGLPVDEAGYQALFRGYGTYLVDAIADQVLGQLEGPEAALYPAAMSKLRVQLGLRPWPVTTENGAQNPPPVPWPDEDVALYCVESVVRGGNLFRYDLSANTWTKELSDRVFLSMISTPDHDGVALQEPSTVAGRQQSRFILWRDGVERVLFDAPASSGFASNVLIGGEPTGGLVIYTYAEGQEPAGQAAGHLYWIDSEHCGPTACSSGPILLQGFPFWSPDSSQLITWSYTDGSMARMNATGEPLQQIESGYSPFWLDAKTYGYVRWGVGGGEVVTVDITTGVSRTILSTDELRPLLPDDESPYRLVTIGQVLVGPREPRQLIIPTYVRSDAAADLYFFTFDPRSGDVDLRLALDNTHAYYSVSPDGRWLEVTTLDEARMARSLFLHDLERRATRTYTFGDSSAAYLYASGRPLYASGRYDWSADGQWLLTLNNDVLHLIAPEYDERRTIVPESPGCIFAAWIDHRPR